MAAPAQKRALGALFLLLAAAFAGVAFSAVAADSGGAARWVIAAASAILAVWMLGLSLRALRTRRGAD
jgi:hypothetical protein